MKKKERTALSSIFSLEGIRKLRSLREFLRTSATVEESYEIMRRRLANREQNFLELFREGIYAAPANPYRKMLELAGITYEDIEASTKTNGVEATLVDLRNKGIYLSIDELKAKVPLVRNGVTIDFDARDLQNLRARQAFEVRTSGTRSKGMSMAIGFGFIDQMVINALVTSDVKGISSAPTVVWYPILPSAAGIMSVLLMTKIGMSPKWFTQEIKTTRFFKMTTYGLLATLRLMRVKVARPEYVPLAEAGKIARYLHDAVREHGGAVLTSYVSSGLRICSAATEMGIRLDGVRMALAGEPITPGRREMIQTVGATVVDSYGSTEVGFIATGFQLNPDPEQLHVFTDMLAVIKAPPDPVTGAEPLAFTGLLAGNPLAYVNLELGDSADLERRPCACPLGKMGLDLHIRNIRSFNRVTTEGSTFSTADLVEFVDTVAPRKFGGNVTDYQLIEMSKEGLAKIALVVDPRVGPVDEGEAKREFYAYLDRKLPAVASLIRQADSLVIERRAPTVTIGGKIPPVIIQS